MHGDEDELKNENSAPSRQTLSDWLGAHEADLITALRPFAHLLYSTLGLTLEEITSELLVEVTHRALRNASNYDPTRPPLMWLLGIARNVVLEWKDREIKWRLRYKNTPSATLATDSETADPIEQLISSAQPDLEAVAIGSMWAEDMLHRAPETHREFMKAYMATDFDTDETAAVLGITSVNARQRLFRARKWFKDRLHLTQETLSHGGRQ